MKTAKMAKKMREKRVERACQTASYGVQIPIMEMPRMWKVAERALEEGATDEEMLAKVRAYVETIRVR